MAKAKRKIYQAKAREARKQRPFYVLKGKVSGFQSRNDRPPERPFSYLDVLNKFGENPKCYLTGRPVSYSDGSTYQLDHIVPSYRGGSNELDNMEIICPEANTAKSFLSLEAFKELCRAVAKMYP